MIENLDMTSALTAGPAPFAPPAQPETQEGRILSALGLLRGPLPHAVAKWLARYHEYLAARLRFPFDARCPEETGVLRPWTSSVTVVALLPPSEHSARDGTGLKCRAFRGDQENEIPLVDLEVDGDHPNAQLIEDYWYWFWNWQFDPKI